MPTGRANQRVACCLWTTPAQHGSQDRVSVHRLAQFALAVAFMRTAKFIDYRNRWSRVLAPIHKLNPPFHSFGPLPMASGSFFDIVTQISATYMGGVACTVYSDGVLISHNIPQGPYTEVDCHGTVP